MIDNRINSGAPIQHRPMNDIMSAGKERGTPSSATSASGQVRTANGSQLNLVATSQRKDNDTSSTSALSSRIDTPKSSGKGSGVLDFLKSLFKGSSQLSQKSTADMDAPTKSLTEYVTGKVNEFMGRNDSLKTNSDNIQARAETHVVPAARQAIEDLAGNFSETVKYKITGAYDAKSYDALAKLTSVIEADPSDIKSIAKASKGLNKDLQNGAVEAFKRAHPSASKSEIKQFASEFQGRMKEAMTSSLNKASENWQVTTETVSLSVDSQKALGAGRLAKTEISFTATSTPAAQLGALAKSYKDDGLSGVSSISTGEANHAVNLWTSELKGAHTSYAAVRHGVNHPFGLKGSAEEIKAGADNRTREVVTAAAATKADAIKEHLKNNPNEPFELTIVSTSLLTAAKKAKTYEVGQQDAWKRAADPQDGIKEVQVDLGDGNGPQAVKIKLDVLPFSMGVNGFAKLGMFSGEIGKRIGDKLTGWNWADNHNQVLLEKLDKAAEAAQNRDGDTGKGMRIMSYRQQLTEAIADGKQRRSAGNAYGVAVLVNLIANEIGAVPAINCMSGKDRTGYLDAAVKARLMEVESMNAGREIKSNVPKIYGERTTAQNELLTLSTETMGGKAIQKACTGVAGYKVGEGGIFRVQANLDNVRNSADLLGLSAAVKA
ncbi:inositol phosphate phosphatase SopB [Polycladidibacter hongkongensis]|uniref:inositol phosphate phosphatase SopB n=1 Tax=Polycladidibacter hongkongensis TaxID=1647556 RepID=UPI000830C25A|nr:inositol phosphate phosphatase SopB [Pseudovibrio hongkongensis]